MNENHPTNDPAEPGEVPDPNLGLSNDEAGNPSPEPPEDDQEIGDAEIIEGDGSDYDDEEDVQ